MSVHMVRILAEPAVPGLDQAVDNWVQNHTEWQGDPVEHTMTTVDSQLIDGPVHVRGDYRFLQEEPASDLLDDLESRLQSIAGGVWYRLGYHECDHGESETTPCSWEQTREGGSVPTEVPEL